MFSLAHELSTLILLNSKTHKFFLVSSILVLWLKHVVFVSIYLDLLCGWIIVFINIQSIVEKNFYVL